MITAIGAKPLLALAAAALFALSMVLHFTNREAIVPLFIVALLVTVWLRGSIVSAMSFTGLSRDMSILLALVVVTLAVCHVHTFEIVSGLAKAALAAVYQAGFYLGTALGRL